MRRIEICPARDHKYFLICYCCVLAYVTYLKSGITSSKFWPYLNWNRFKFGKLIGFLNNVLVIVQLNKEGDRLKHMKLWDRE